MRSALLAAGVAMALVQLEVPSAASDRRVDAQVENETHVLGDFHGRVRLYVELHRQLEGPVPTIASSTDWAEIKAESETLATKISAARKDARQGDIFTPDIEHWFRRKVAEYLEGCNTEELLAALNEENPKGLVLIPRINGRWPEDASLGPMPPKLLAGLPQIPEELQYRFMNRDLILWDVHANIVVDFIKQAMP